MQDSDQRDGTPKHCKENKKPTRWPDYFSWMVAYARRLVGPNDAEDIANAALYDVCCSDRPRPPIEHEDEAKRLLRHLLWLRAREHWKKQRRRRSEVPSSIDSDGWAHGFVGTKRSDVMLDRIVIERVLTTLNVQDRELVLGYYVGGFTAEELARHHHMNESTVRSRIARAMTRLAEVLAERRVQVKQSRGVVFLLELVRARLSDIAESIGIRQWFANFANNGRNAVAYAGCLVPLALIPGDAPETMFVEGEVPVIQAQPFGIRSWMIAPLINTTYARLDSKPQSVETREGKRMRRKKDVSGVPLTNVIDVQESLPTSKPPNPDLELSSARLSSDACHNDIGLALAQLNIGKPRECIAILDRSRSGPHQCEETQEWSRLRANCVSASRKNTP